MNLFCFLLVLCSAGEAQVTLRGDGFRFPVTVEFETADGAKSQATWYGKDNEVAAKLTPGTYTILSRNHRLGFPQPVQYVLIGKTMRYASGVTIDHKRMEIKDGDILAIVVHEPLSSYNMADVRIPDCNVYGRITGARPYWFQAVGKGQFAKDAPEAYPNGILFLSDPAWGIEKVAADLAEKAYNGIHAEKVETYDHRGNCHWTYMHTVGTSSTDGTIVIPEALKKVTKEQFKDAFAETFRTMLTNNCYRPFAAAEVKEMVAVKWLPAETPIDRPLVLTLGQGVEYGKNVFPEWNIRRALEKAN